METMTDTPETDAVNAQGVGYALRFYAMKTHARKLERERDEAREQVREEQRLHIQTLDERDEARQWESQAIVARIQRDEFSKTLGEVREILCEALPNENQLTSSMAVKLVRERDQAARLVRRLLRSHGEKSSRRSVNARSDAGLWLARYDSEDIQGD